jgi:putative phage-type endonuclease
MKPGDAEWTRLVTASKVAAILGLSPWDSPRTMWLRMRGELTNDQGNSSTRRGQYLEAGVIAWWKDQHPGLGETFEQVNIGLDDESGAEWASATPDLIGSDDGYGNPFVMDAKTAASADDWGQPGTDEVPAYYAAQILWQMACYPDAQIGYVAVLFGRPRLDFAEYIIPRDPALIDLIVAQCREFYESLSADVPPPLSDMTCEYDAIRKVHTEIDRDAIAVLPDDLASRYLTDLAHEERSKATKARVLDAMGQARLAKTQDGLTIARRQPKGDAVTLARVAALPDLGATA